MIGYLNACAAMSGMARPEGLSKLRSNSENRSVWVTEASALIVALILIAELLEVCGHGPLLVERAHKEVREAAAGEVRCDLGEVAPPRCSADAGDVGTCESMAV